LAGQTHRFGSVPSSIMDDKYDEVQIWLPRLIKLPFNLSRTIATAYARDERLFARSPHRLATDRRSCGRAGRGPFRTLSRVLVARKRPDGALTVCGRCEFEVWSSAENEWHLGGGYDLIAANSG